MFAYSSRVQGNHPNIDLKRVSSATIAIDDSIIAISHGAVCPKDLEESDPVV
jgi:hypothetical protein